MYEGKTVAVVVPAYNEEKLVAETVLRFAGNPIPVATIVLVALFTISGLQLLLFAMWFDMESNKDLR